MTSPPRTVAAAIEQILNAKATTIRVLTRADPTEWTPYVMKFVEALMQAEHTDGAVVLTVLLDLWQHIVRAADEHGAVRLVTALLSARRAWTSETSGDVICRGFGHEVSAILSELDRDRRSACAQDAASYILCHLGDRLTVSTVAAALDIEPAGLRQSICQEYRTTFHQLTKMIRLRVAHEKILDGDKIESVMSEVGWKNRTTFFRAFRLTFGVLPGQLRRSMCAPAGTRE